MKSIYCKSYHKNDNRALKHENINKIFEDIKQENREYRNKTYYFSQKMERKKRGEKIRG
jgi:hypothetical protein